MLAFELGFSDMRSRTAGGKWIGAALVALALAVPALAQDDLQWEAPDGSFPDHGGCTYLGPNDHAAIQSMAQAFAEAERRTKVTRAVLQALPRRRYGGVLPARRNEGSVDGGAAGCAGIDACIERAAEAAGKPLAGLATDAEFLRRARLDLTGRIPTKEEVLEFLADTSPDKRERVVERLLDTPEWADRWAMFFGDLFRNTIRTAQVNRYQWGRDSFHMYLLESLRQNKPYDLMAREILAAEGVSDGRTYPPRYTSYEHYESTYLDLVGNPVKASAVGWLVGGQTTGGPTQDTYDSLAFFTARDFLGISVSDCVLCHDGVGRLEPLSSWGASALRLELWELAAFFSDVPRYQTWRLPGRNRVMRPNGNGYAPANYYTVSDLAEGGLQMTRFGDMAGVYLAQTEGGNRPDRVHFEKYVEPKYPFESTAVVSPGLRLREQLGYYLTGDPQFARATVNYIWREFFARGIVEPPDQFDLMRIDPSSPPPEGWDLQPSHPRLLQWLAAEFQDNGFDLKWLMREISISQGYQRSSRYDGVFTAIDDRYFVRHHARRLTAEQIHDAVTVASQWLPFYSVSRTFRRIRFAMQFPDVIGLPPGRRQDLAAARALLQSFTPGDREETPRSSEGSPLQALTLMNNPLVLQRVRNSPTLTESLELPDDALVTNLYLHVLSRPPSDEEVAFGVEYLQGGDRRDQASNLLWALLNKTDFYFNY
ncbi:MAG: DUF1553 domain-containing protein [Bryobacterales bacterium]|nr:DUF1553 domain-containing protein [Bryobacterales bacterium]